MAKKTICYYTNQTAEPWSSLSLDRGVGGSQTAVIYLSRIWVKMGFDVKVYCNLDVHEGTYDGVKYRDYKNFNPLEEVEILIIWRDLNILNKKIKAKHIYLDLHDVPDRQDYKDDRVSKIEKIFVKSKYHKTLLPDHVQKNAEVISNGADIDLFLSKNTKRNKFKFVYASDYYRGLELMLRFGWPLIKRAIPEAELDIFYGWDFFDLVWKDDLEKKAWKQMMIDLMKQPSIKENGRVSQQVLAHNLKTANILYYGCNFKEVDCITVRQAAIAGCIPCTTSYAALSDKVYSIKTVGNPFLKETHQLLAQNIIDLLGKKENIIESLRNSFQTRSKRESWDWVAKRWSEFF